MSKREVQRITNRRDAAATPANVVIREVCSRDGIVLDHIVADHDGTHEAMVQAARRVTKQMFEAFADASNVNSRIIATDASGRPHWSVSPNFQVIEELAIE